MGRKQDTGSGGDRGDGEGRWRRGGVWAGVAVGSTVAALVAVLAPFIAPGLRSNSPPFIPTTAFHVKTIARICAQNNCRRLLDLGSGDGRIPIEVAKHVGISTVGVELNPWLVAVSRLKSLRAGTWNLTSFVRQDMWRFPVCDFDAVVVFGVKEMMPQLERKLDTELQPGALVMSCHFHIPGRMPLHTFTQGSQTLLLYRW
ncbi:hypothetical protein PTSG_12620 [Salpingoeca rosetta]|uniref:Methyltransferase domain-containing protein n=1 Tax=Salpingoeca rosetta (strain ATCC 50818 / BSB-021) TaxID=946362 RepID=F2UHI0_SALR5|nr:uncharacterized protein PTSG_12620 [Salpingoeca rosetta]EGD76579.1 hypothetical protein PTSG_12620 [Salpingoeca rosetta]|eukprot:XP_004991493.1 hypothetical protein PTSG_12620 [Salpingoeca rosetta]